MYTHTLTFKHHHTKEDIIDEQLRTTAYIPVLMFMKMHNLQKNKQAYTYELSRTDNGKTISLVNVTNPVITTTHFAIAPTKTKDTQYLNRLHKIHKQTRNQKVFNMHPYDPHKPLVLTDVDDFCMPNHGLIVTEMYSINIGTEMDYVLLNEAWCNNANHFKCVHLQTYAEQYTNSEKSDVSQLSKKSLLSLIANDPDISFAMINDY